MLLVSTCLYGFPICVPKVNCIYANKSMISMHKYKYSKSIALIVALDFFRMRQSCSRNVDFMKSSQSFQRQIFHFTFTTYINFVPWKSVLSYQTACLSCICTTLTNCKRLLYKFKYAKATTAYK